MWTLITRVLAIHGLSILLADDFGSLACVGVWGLMVSGVSGFHQTHSISVSSSPSLLPVVSVVRVLLATWLYYHGSITTRQRDAGVFFQSGNPYPCYELCMVLMELE